MFPRGRPARSLGGATKWAYLDHPGPIPFAHRGGSGERPENTMGAFEHAVSLGFGYLETDVHSTADGVLLAFHDSVLDRVTDQRGAVAELPWAVVKKARIASEPIALFEDLLGAWPDVRINVDAKSDASVEPLMAALARTGAHDRVAIASFSTRRLRRIRRLAAGRVCTAMAPSEIARLRAGGYGLPTGRLRAAAAQVPLAHGRLRIVDEGFVAAAHRRGLVVHVWTVDSESEMVRLLDLGVDGLMTDEPALLKAVLQRRNQWFG